MTASSSGNSKKFRKVSTDMIMNLPSHLVQQILEALPLQDGARTSVLSRDWRYKWSSIPQISLDLKFSDTFRKRENAIVDYPRAYSDVVNKILLRHRGPILKFVFIIPWQFPKSGDNIDCWIEFVCLNGVKEFNLHDRRLPKLKLPSCLFSCVSLTHLTLFCGSISPPPTFEGFPCLISLKLSTCEDDNQKLERLFNNCPQLESLNLSLFEAINCLTIRAPKLQDLVLHAMLHSLFLEETARLKTMNLHIDGDSPERVDMVKFLSSLPNVVELRLSGFNKCGRVPPKSLARELEQLHTLILDAPLSCQYTISIVVSLLKSSPKLSQLKITALECECCEDNSVKFDGSFRLESLKTVEILRFSGVSSELHMVKFLLAHSPALELMTIEFDLSEIKVRGGKFRLASEVTRFPRASPNAEIALTTLTPPSF